MSQRPEGTRFAVKPAADPGQPDLLLIGRLVLAAALLAVALLVELPAWLKIVLLVLSAVASGFDLGLKAFDSVLDGDYFATPIILLFVAFVSFLIGFGGEGAAMLLLYQLGLFAIAYVEKRSRASALGLLNGQDQEIAARAQELYADEDATRLNMEPAARSSASFILKIAMVVALLYTFLLPLLGDYSYKVSIHRALMIILISIPTSVVAAMPVTALAGLCFGAKQGVLFHDARAMERASGVNVAVFDKAGIFSESEPELLAADSSVLDQRTFLNFVAHAVYYSEQPFARAIPQLAEQDYRLDVISDFVDVPGCGVELKIGGSPVILATANYMAARGVQIPEEATTGETYYLSVAGRYVGYLCVSAQVNENAGELVEGMRDAGVRELILLTEDGAGESRRLAEELGMDDVYGECDTERKLQHIEDLNQGTRNHVMFLYSNGVETHSAADVDVRLSHRAKYADVEIAPEKSEELPFAISISRRMCDVAKENAFFAFGLKGLLIFLSMIGCGSLWFMMFMEIAANIGTHLNSIRVTQAPLIDFEKLFGGKQEQ